MSIENTPRRTGDIVSQRAAGLKPYTPGEQPKDGAYIKLNTNENPYPPAPAVKEYLAHVDTSDLRLYPDPEAEELRRTLSQVYGLAPENYFAGNGSDEVLSFIFYAFFDKTRGPLLFPEHTYSFYPVYCAFYGIDYKKIPLTGGFALDLNLYSEETKNDGITGIIFPNPNAPIGRAVERREIEKLLGALPGNVPVVVDEAYVDFGAESSLPLVRDFQNLIVVQTFSKSRSLAGLRVGYAAAHPEIIKVLHTVKNSFNSYPLDVLSQKTASLSLSEGEHFETTRRRIIATRERTAEALSHKGWEVIPSRANFICARHPSIPGKEVYEGLKKKGILVRHFATRGIEDFVRISIGTEEEMDAFIRAAGSLVCP
ncbi:MAG: histidinol-phosphate transaminase [Spirochaetaceae bacterium]